ncbi:MAG TPA: FAD-binding oxidoreductase [Candidatus Binatia bacterium]|nr:FAD-binding oxidoreductase [Candidatus Binatia bacterium]
MTEIGAALAAALGPDRVAEDAATLAAHRVDYWVLAHLRARQGRLDPGPACVVRPRSTAEVAAAVRLAQRHGVAVVPWGGGSGVCGGALAPAGALVIDLRALDRLLEVNETALVARVEAGMMGDAYEAAVTARGYTTGHYPQSIARSTVGGWVATRAAGQFSTRYGNIEDLCLGLEAVLASGEVVRIDPVPRASTGPSLRELFLGNEGTLGIVTEVALRLHPLPAARQTASFVFPDMRAGLDAIRRIVRVGWRPAVVRLYDPTETARQFSAWVPGEGCLLLVLSEGPEALVAAEMGACGAEAEAGGGRPGGREPVAHWLEQRNTVPSWDFFLEREMVVDTIEVAATWDRVPRLYETVIASLRQIPGMLAASAHSSHSYPQGTNLYVTFAIKPADFVDAEAAYLDAWGRTMDATLAAGGTISHHHGIGRLRAPWLAAELRTAHPLLAALKRALDPAGLLNPGALLGR